MTKAFWLFAKNIPPNEDGDNMPDLPPLNKYRYVNPGDINLMGDAFGHKHLLVGGFGIADDNLIGQAGEGHTHLVVKVGGEYRQVTKGVADHAHPLNVDVNGNLAQDYFMLFIACSDADALAIANHPGCFPIVEAEITIGPDGNRIGVLDNTAWTPVEKVAWNNRSKAILGFELPAEIDRGARLVALFTGVLLARPAMSEFSLRFDRADIEALGSAFSVTEIPLAEIRPVLNAMGQVPSVPLVRVFGREIPAYSTRLGKWIYNLIRRT